MVAQTREAALMVVRSVWILAMFEIKANSIC